MNTLYLYSVKRLKISLSHMIQPPINQKTKKKCHTTRWMTQVKTTFRPSKVSHKKINFTKSNSKKRERRSNRLIQHVHHGDIERRRDNDGGKLRLISCCDLRLWLTTQTPLLRSSTASKGSLIGVPLARLQRRRKPNSFKKIYIYFQISVFWFYMDFGGFN